MATIDIQNYLSANLFEELGLDSMQEDKKKAFIEKFGEVMTLKILNRIATELSLADQDEFDKLLDESADDRDKVMAFLSVKVPNMNQIAEEEIAKYKKVLIDQFNPNTIKI